MTYAIALFNCAQVSYLLCVTDKKLCKYNGASLQDGSL